MLALALRYLGQAAVYLGIAALLGTFSNTPAYVHYPPDQALIKLSLVHSAQRKEECRRLSAEEIAELAPNMRKNLACARERLPVRLELSVDGETLVSGSFPPTGLSSDGPSLVYRRLPVAPGKHRLILRMRDSNRQEGYDYEYESVVDLRPQQNLVIDFRSETGGFNVR